MARYGNKRVALLRSVKLNGSWRMCVPHVDAKGRVSPEFVKVQGTETDRVTRDSEPLVFELVRSWEKEVAEGLRRKLERRYKRADAQRGSLGLANGRNSAAELR